ncbi:MAG: CDP-diacylglycerol--glycerol-3-phosphate 3-phosphatidyltransferase [Chloroflexota bacterium]|nr:CDP-diacylglycerol--glycerol-3-phosphate 3-phosphatidyltransferase [Chloroflexota bacterium]
MRAVASLPNLLGVARIVATPVVALLILLGFAGAGLIAFLVFAAAAVSDVVDGRVARARGAVTPLGVFMDLTADKVLVAGVMIAMVEVDVLPTWIAALLIVREFVVQGARGVAAEAGLVIPARGLGKGKAFATYAGIGLLLLAYDAATGGPVARAGPAGGWLGATGWWLMVLATALSVASGAIYLRSALRSLLTPGS